MKKLTGTNHTYVLYNDIKEMSIGQYKDFMKASYIDSGLGSDMESIRDKVVSIWSMIEAGKEELVKNELNNIFNCSNFVLNGFNTSSDCFLYLLHSVDDVRVNLLTDDLDKLREQLEADISMVTLQEVVEEVKKNYQPN
jgi:hypothetical protein